MHGDQHRRRRYCNRPAVAAAPMSSPGRGPWLTGSVQSEQRPDRGSAPGPIRCRWRRAPAAKDPTSDSGELPRFVRTPDTRTGTVSSAPPPVDRPAVTDMHVLGDAQFLELAPTSGRRRPTARDPTGRRCRRRSAGPGVEQQGIGHRPLGLRPDRRGRGCAAKTPGRRRRAVRGLTGGGGHPPKLEHVPHRDRTPSGDATRPKRSSVVTAPCLANNVQ